MAAGQGAQRHAGWVAAAVSLAVALALERGAGAVDIQGVLPAAADYPQTHALLIDPTTGAVVTGSGAYSGVYDIQGYLDTGTSGILLSQETQQGLGVGLDSYIGTPTTFNDYTVGGIDTYWVSPPYSVSTAPFSADNDAYLGNPPPATSAYTNTVGPLQMEINQQAANAAIGPIDILGMPVMMNKVTVLDIRPDNSTTNLGETKTYIYNPGTPYNPGTLDTNPGIVPTQYYVRLTYTSFSSFTRVSPSGAPGPQQDPNPVIGPNPVDGTSASTPPVTISFTGRTATGSFLFDTGAQASFISTAEAAALDVTYASGTNASGDPYLITADTQQTIPHQFVISLVGANGQSQEAAGFYLDSLALQTTEGATIRFLEAPVFVEDVTLQNPTTGQTLTLDGDLGMNFFEPSMDVNGANAVTSPFDWLTIDEPGGMLGLTLAAPTPEPTTLGLLALGAATLLLTRRRRLKSKRQTPVDDGTARCSPGAGDPRFLPELPRPIEP